MRNVRPEDALETARLVFSNQRQIWQAPGVSRNAPDLPMPAWCWRAVNNLGLKTIEMSAWGVAKRVCYFVTLDETTCGRPTRSWQAVRRGGRQNSTPAP